MRAFRSLVLAAALVASGSGGAVEKPRWFSDANEATVAKWGIPEVGAVGFVVRCDRAGTIWMMPALYAMAEPGKVPDVRFEIDGKPFVRSARLAFLKDDQAWQAAVRLRKDDALIDAMRKGSRLSYDFEPPLREGDRFTLSLSGSAKAIDKALEAC